MIFQCSHFVGFVVCNVIAGPNQQPSIMNSRLKNVIFTFFSSCYIETKLFSFHWKTTHREWFNLSRELIQRRAQRREWHISNFFSCHHHCAEWKIKLTQCEKVKRCSHNDKSNRVIDVFTGAREKGAKEELFYAQHSIIHEFSTFFVCRQHLYLIDCLRQWEREASTKFHICNISCCHLPPVSRLRFILI